MFDAHLRDRRVAQRPGREGLLDVDQEQREAGRAWLRLGGRDGPRDRDHPVGPLDVGDPDLLALDQEVRQPSRRALVLISIALEPASGSVRPKLNWTSPEARPGQDLLLLLLGAVADQGGHAEAGVEHVEERAGRAAGGAEGLAGDGRLEQALPAAAVLLGDAEPEPAALGEVAVDLGRVALLVLAARPVVVVVLGGHGGDAVADGEGGVGKVEVHRQCLRGRGCGR